MTETREQKAARLGREAARSAMQGQRRLFTITNFGRHEDGYFHGHVTQDGQRYYVHCRYGSWMAPGTVHGRAIMKELESLGLPIEVKHELSSKANTIERRERERDAAAATGDSDADPAATGEVDPSDLREGGDGKGSGAATAELE